MTESRSGKNSKCFLRPSGEWCKWIRIPFGCSTTGLLYLMIVVIVTAAGGISGWEEGDDAVNVISVENLDALLGLRMVTELKTFEGVKKSNESEPRAKRMTHVKPKTFPVSSHVSLICTRRDCTCNYVGSGYVNVTCDFTSRTVIDLAPGSVPPNTINLHISNVSLLHVMPGAFSHHPHLVTVSIHKADNVTVSGFAFQNLSDVPFNLEIKDCKSVTLEEHSFRNLQSPLRALIQNCERVVLKKSIFSWLLAFQMINVPNLELVENTFSVEVKQYPGPTETMILFQNVSVNEIPNATFPLSAAKIRFVDCFIKTIESGAFNAIVLVSVYFERTKLKRMQTGAFSERTLIQNFELTGVEIETVDSNVLSAAARLTIQNSRIDEVTGGAFNVNTAYLKLLGNDFRRIRRHAFEIQQWNSIIIRGNRFQHLEPDSFSAPFSNVTKVRNEFVFANNTLTGVQIDVLSFIPNEPGLDGNINNNVFEEPCHCHLETWMRERSAGKWENFYETSSCVVTPLLEKCYNITRGYMNMKEYMEEYCTPANMIVCEDVRRTYHPNILIPIDLENTERTVLGVIFLGVVCSIAIMLTILSFMWMKQRGVCGTTRKTGSSGLFTMCSGLCNKGNLVTSNSISRINIHEYAEIQNRLNNQQKQTILAVEEDGSDEEEIVIYENKATQTLPEELTQELLQTLREKLDDPDNYNEARDMIEHLYDLIKVEESCNNNNVTPRTSFLFDDEDEEPGGIYEVIGSKKQTQARNSKTKRKGPGVDVTTTGTRAPSPDKLSPITFNLSKPMPTIVNDYVEPRDRKSNEYCELPTGNLIMPDVLTSTQIKDNNSDLSKAHIYAEPLHNILRRPLPDQPGSSNS